MSVTLTKDKRSEVRYYTRSIEFENAAPILLERNYSHGGKEFLPSEAFARWSHGEPIESIKVSGYVLKKDRTTGNQRTEITYITPASRSWSRGRQPDAPDWLLELFDIEASTIKENNA